MKSQQMKITAHQQRVLAAIRALEVAHDLPWWPRYEIGRVVGAGGYHGVIQVRTMGALKGMGLVRTEWSSWPKEVAALVRCSCACAQWGLTEEGRSLADSFNVRWSQATANRVKGVCKPQPGWLHDEDEDPEDDDGGDGEPVDAPKLTL